MAFNTLEVVPDYLKDFEEIQGITYALDSIIATIVTDTTVMNEKILLSNHTLDRWEKIIEKTLYMNDIYQFAENLLTKKSVVTINELGEYLLVWLKSGKYALEYDNVNMVLKIKTTLSEFHIDSVKKMIRNMVPLNFELEFEFVDEL